MAAASALLGWVLVEKCHKGKPTVLGAASRFLAGLVAVTPATGFVTPGSALIIGFIGGIICYEGVFLKSRLRYDDALDVVGIHGVGGTWGALATGIFSSAAVTGIFVKKTQKKVVCGICEQFNLCDPISIQKAREARKAQAYKKAPWQIDQGAFSILFHLEKQYRVHFHLIQPYQQYR